MEYLNFIDEVLAPQASESLRTFYQKYCDGIDIGVETKSDDSPASLADRETEKILRDLIMDQYPDHGIWGEEFGAYQVTREYVWVLDPLDGTREFLSKKPGYFGTLIGLFYQGKALSGAILDPFSNQIWLSACDGNTRPVENGKTLKDGIVACTNPQIMFPTPSEQTFIRAVQDNARDFKTNLNYMGFAQMIEGRIDAVVESDLSLHDLGALIPLLQSAGKTIIDFEGNDYVTKQFNFIGAQKQKFNVIAAENIALAQEILEWRLKQ